MPIVTLQRTLREIGRIRIGTKSDHGYPTKLDTFRFTSNDHQVIDAAADLYGGTVARWTDAPIGEQWEVVTTTNTLTVIVPPGPAALSQWYELWSGGGCQRRCDGTLEVLTDTPCLCDPEARECKATTRLSLILADLPGLGVWRLESHGYYAATELAGTVDVCQQAAGNGRLLPAVLGLQARQIKRVVNGKPQTMNFVVPTLDIKLAPTALGIATGPTSSWQAIAQDTDEPQAITAGEMAAAVERPGKVPAKPRANAAAPIPPTGLKPRPANITAIEVNEARIAQLDLADDHPHLTQLEAHYGNRAKALTAVRHYCRDNDLDLPSVFGDITDDLAASVLEPAK